MQDPELSNVEQILVMELFVFITVAFLGSSSVAMFLSNKAEQRGHNDKGGCLYYLVTGLAGIVYTFQNVILRLTGSI